MRLSKTDRQILTALRKKEECMVKDIVNATGLYYSNVSRRLQVLKRHGIVQNSIMYNERHYSLNKKLKANFYYLTVECPKCAATKEVHDYAHHVTCPDPSCRTADGNRTRFYVTKDRIIKTRDIVRGIE